MSLMDWVRDISNGMENRRRARESIEEARETRAAYEDALAANRVAEAEARKTHEADREKAHEQAEKKRRPAERAFNEHAAELRTETKREYQQAPPKPAPVPPEKTQERDATRHESELQPPGAKRPPDIGPGPFKNSRVASTYRPPLAPDIGPEPAQTQPNRSVADEMMAEAKAAKAQTPEAAPSRETPDPELDAIERQLTQGGDPRKWRRPL
jgi:hypothetical protein